MPSKESLEKMLKYLQGLDGPSAETLELIKKIQTQISEIDGKEKL